jgi:hypothetical protein
MVTVGRMLLSDACLHVGCAGCLKENSGVHIVFAAFSFFL